MRIFSKFHDYYDGLISHSEPYYQRFEKERIFDHQEHCKVPNFYCKKTKTNKGPYTVIGFCGKLYMWHQDANGAKPFLFSVYQNSISKFFHSNLFTLKDFCSKFLDKEVYFKVSNVQNNYKKLKVTSNFNSLKKYNFAKVFDPYTAFQEIEMYVGTILVSEKQPPQIVNDKILLQAKGFDKKTSFRHPVK